MKCVTGFAPLPMLNPKEIDSCATSPGFSAVAAGAKTPPNRPADSGQHVNASHVRPFDPPDFARAGRRPHSARVSSGAGSQVQASGLYIGLLPNSPALRRPRVT